MHTTNAHFGFQKCNHSGVFRETLEGKGMCRKTYSVIVVVKNL